MTDSLLDNSLLLVNYPFLFIDTLNPCLFILFISSITSWFWSCISFDEWFSHLMHLTQSWFVGDIAKIHGILVHLSFYIFPWQPTYYLCNHILTLSSFLTYTSSPLYPSLLSKYCYFEFFPLALYSKVFFFLFFAILLFKTFRWFVACILMPVQVIWRMELLVHHEESRRSNWNCTTCPHSCSS